MKSLVLLFETFFALQWNDMDVQVDGLGKMGKEEGPKVRRDVCFLSPGGWLPLLWSWESTGPRPYGSPAKSPQGASGCGSAVAETIP